MVDIFRKSHDLVVAMIKMYYTVNSTIEKLVGFCSVRSAHFPCDHDCTGKEIMVSIHLTMLFSMTTTLTLLTSHICEDKFRQHIQERYS